MRVVPCSLPLELDYLTALNGTLSEWTSREDDEAYGNHRLTLASLGTLSPADQQAVTNALTELIS